MTITSNIKVLKLRFQMNSSVSNSSLVFLDNISNSLLFFWGNIQVFPSSNISVLGGDRFNSSCGVFINTLNSEGRIDQSTKFTVIEHIVGGFVFQSKSIKFFFC